jgi:CPA1 family monovalent cation:H+ antiporter
MALLVIGVITSGLGRKSPIPYTVTLVIIGIVLGEFSRNWEPLALLQDFMLTPEMVLFIFLPTLIFESGLKLDSRQLIKDLAPVMMLAIPALLLSTTIIGLGIWLLFSVDLITALLFGALISATDPVAVIALFQELGTPHRLTVLVEGESLMNDASAIVLFSILLGLALAGNNAQFELIDALLQFVEVFFGGIAVGALMGFMICSMLSRLRLSVGAVISLSMGMAYGAFIVTEHFLHLSGVMAVVSCALVFGIIGAPKLSQEKTTALAETWEFLVFAANTLLFILVGLSIDITTLFSHIDTIIMATILVLVARAGAIYTLVPLTIRAFNLPRVSLSEQHVMWWGGLKGGLAIAIVLSIPDSLPGKELLINLTLGVVLFTLLVNAPSIRPLINLLGINKMDQFEKAELKLGIEAARESAHQLLSRFHNSQILSRASFHLVDDRSNKLFNASLPESSSENQYRLERLNLLRIESNTLNQLYHQEVIPQYTFLDLRGELRRKRDHLISGVQPIRSIQARKANLFLRLEDTLLKWLREHDWAITLLTYYQSKRISQHLIKDIASIFMTQAAIEAMERIEGLSADEIERIREGYQHRLDIFIKRITDTKLNYPEFYQRYEQHLSLQTALRGALHIVSSSLHNSIIGGKAYAKIRQDILSALESIPPITNPTQELDTHQLICIVPLFKGLPESITTLLSQQARLITFLADDTVVEQGEHGNALYIVAHGQFGVYRVSEGGEEQLLAQLSDGDFFGEVGLLENAIRTATVRALREGSVLRLTHKVIIELSKQHHEVAERLQHAHEEGH